jgi:hypothetical protein
VRSFSPVPPLEAPPAPPLGVPATRVAVGGEPDDGGDDSSSSHNTDLSEEQETEGWVARPITRDAACGCHFHDALDTLPRQALDRVYLVYRVSLCCLPAQSRGLPGPLRGDLFGAPSGEQSPGCEGLLGALLYL